MGSQNGAPVNTVKPSSAFSSLNTAKPATAPATGGGVFGSISLTSKGAPDPPKSSNVFGSVALHTSNNSIPIGIKKTPATPAATTIAANESNTESNSKMQKLNKSFMSWLDKQMVNHSVSNWTAGLQDYIKHADKIAATLPAGDEVPKVAPPGNQKADNATAPGAAKFGGFGQESTNSAPKTTTFSVFSAPPAASGPVASADQKPDFGGFSATTAAAKPASFGFVGTGASKPAAFTGFGGAASAASTKPAASTGFGAGASTAFGSATTTASSGGGGGGETEEYEGEPLLEPETIYKNENDTDEILYETNCKAYRFDTGEKEWKESGKGTLRITQEPGIDKKKILVRNTIGKITINSYIFKGMNFRQVGKTGLQFIAVTDASGDPQSFLVKVKASEIQATVEKFKKAEEEAKK